MSSDDPFGGGGDWGDEPQPLNNNDENIDMNYGQPLGQGQQQQPPSQPPQPNQQPGPPGGGQLQSTTSKLENDDVIAMVVTAFLPGIGQLMLGQQTKGIVILLANIFTCGMGGLLWVAVLIDCYLVAKTRKYRQLDEWEIFPDINKHLGSG